MWVEFSWCKVHGKSINNNDNPFAILAQRRSWIPLVKIAKADGLIIQMDTDIVQYITDLIPLYQGKTKNERKRFASKAILNWLGEESLPDEIYLLLSTDSTETWLLATHSRIEEIFDDLPKDFDFEEIQNVVKRLFDLGYHSYIDPKDNKKRLTKSIYIKYAKKIAYNLEEVRIECEEAEKLYHYLG